MRISTSPWARNPRKTPSTIAADKSGMGLSALAYRFLAGVLTHARALAAVAAPTVNSYKRLVVGRSLSGSTWAPAYIAYGDNNRTACVRVPFGRLEVRLPDSGCNPIPRLGGIDRCRDSTASTASSIRDPAQNINLYELTPEQLKAKGIKLLPQSLNEAIDALEADAVICDGLGQESRARVHPIEADGMDRVLATRVGVGVEALPGILLATRRGRIGAAAMCGIVGLLIKQCAAPRALGRAHGAHAHGNDRSGSRLGRARGLHRLRWPKTAASSVCMSAGTPSIGTDLLRGAAPWNSAPTSTSQCRATTRCSPPAPIPTP